MNKYIDAEKLIAEIERRKVILDKYKDSFESAACCNQELEWMKDFITFLQEEPAEWSEKDEDMLLSAIEYVQTYPAHRQSVVTWLKDLPNRFALQPKQEWSEEDEEILGKLRRLILICRGEKKFIQQAEFDKLDNWLKSFRPQPILRPSKVQMEALMYATGEGGTYNKEALKSLMDDLKKRM